MNGSPRTRRGDGGFSLLEVLCGILILGIGLVGITEAITLALRASKDSERQTAAALLASGRLEFLRADGFIIEGEDEGEFADAPLYGWTETIRRTAIDGLYEAAITVRLKASGETLYELKTFIFDAPLGSLTGTLESGSGAAGSAAGRENPRRRSSPGGGRGS